ncbi:MAG: class I SAM-dependent RNA methyltransferase [Candidatus Devosia phytovorans]|uniref:Class I SAM-dependent RNA methyltransferase n=1 Tax=Candidatus Devosia phytovorans TaxID=3121372 RepID=A0AAJ5VUQ0_9HYPH|nr:class I SAM-dependent RNA methyltransferase [Devosia sp.]WEK05218.1 MAG: class I SAM-dependent RNA methyltransferase [Devosia sp.]
MTAAPFEIYLVATPGLEAPLCAEAREVGFAEATVVDGGVAFMGSWPDVWKANLELRGATRVLARVASFRALHLAQLDKRARKVEWASFLSKHVPVKVEASCKRSRIYHAGAASQRVAKAISEELGAPISDDAELRIMVRIEDDLVTISVDTTGESLHKRGFKEGVAKAPMRETMAAMFLRQCGYDGSQPVLDPMCGSGTFIIEAAEIALGFKPGRERKFAFEQLPSFDARSWGEMLRPAPAKTPGVRFYGSDRDAGAIRMATENAARAGVSDIVSFTQSDVENLDAPNSPPGLVIVNPPYGTRIGNKAPLVGLHRALGHIIRSKLPGWQAGIITSDKDLARTTGLKLDLVEPTVLHGGLRIGLWRTSKNG